MAPGNSCSRTCLPPQVTKCSRATRDALIKPLSELPHECWFIRHFLHPGSIPTHTSLETPPVLPGGTTTAQARTKIIRLEVLNFLAPGPPPLEAAPHPCRFPPKILPKTANFHCFICIRRNLSAYSPPRSSFLAYSPKPRRFLHSVLNSNCSLAPPTPSMSGVVINLCRGFVCVAPK